ncbi:MAG: peptidylprolyl isomerase [Syntrophomonadaceae bacterium]
MSKPRLLVILMVLLFVAACSRTAPPVDKTAIEVNGYGVSQSEYNKMLKFRTVLYETQNAVKLDQNKDAAKITKLQDAVYEQMVMDVLIKQEADRRGILAEEKDIDSDLAAMKAGMPAENYQDMLSKTGLSEADIRSMAKTEIITQKLYQAVGQVSDNEAKDFYNEHQGELKQGIEIYHILVATEAEARQVLEQIKTGQDFGRLAAQYSTDPGSKDKGGYLEAANLMSNWVPEFKTAALKLKPGEITTQPVKSDYGFHIIKAGKAVPTEKSSYADLEPQIIEYLQNQKISQMLDTIRKQAVINDLRTK